MDKKDFTPLVYMDKDQVPHIDCPAYKDKTLISPYECYKFKTDPKLRGTSSECLKCYWGYDVWQHWHVKR